MWACGATDRQDRYDGSSVQETRGFGGLLEARTCLYDGRELKKPD